MRIAANQEKKCTKKKNDEQANAQNTQKKKNSLENILVDFIFPS